MKVAIVTSSSRDIGKSMALQVANRRIGVILTYNSRACGRAAVAAQIRGDIGL